MSTIGFSVTFERWDDEALECGETDDRGFVVENVTLRDAIAECGERASGANEWPIRAPRWFNFDADMIGEESRALHVPPSVTPASRRRIARLLGLRVTP